MKPLLSRSLFACIGVIGLNAQVSAATAEVGVPGPRSCFFSHGPVSGAPYVNAAYPDSAIAYWVAVFNTPEGASLELQGVFPHSRAISFSSYNEQGIPVAAVADYLIRPEADGVNPYIPGAPRDSKQRDYRLNVLDAAQPDKQVSGQMPDDQVAPPLYAPTSKNDQQIVIYRIYASDEGLHPTGGAALPEPLLTLKDGTVLQGAEACAALQAAQFPRLSPAAPGMPKAEYLALIDQPDKPDTYPAKQTPEWHIQLESHNLPGIYAGKGQPNAPRSEGGFFANPDNLHIRTLINTRFGDVLVVRGKAPTTPKTRNGNKTMGEGQLRYWSMCSYQGFVSTRVNACVYDEQVPLDADGYYTIMLSKAKDRPRIAYPECGVAWLPVADDGDGVKDPDAGMLQLSNLLAAPDFKQGVNSAGKDVDIGRQMGEYAPRGEYLQSNIIEALWTCPGQR